MLRSQVIELSNGFQVDGNFFKTVTIREPRVSDLLNAEEEMPANGKTVAFRTALIAACIDKVDGYDGMVTFKMVAGLSIVDFNALTDALAELEDQGSRDTKKD